MGLIAAVVFSFVAMLGLAAVALASFLAKFMALAVALSITTIVVVVGLGLYPWRKLRIAAWLGTRDIIAYARRHPPRHNYRISRLLPVRFAGVGKVYDRKGAAPSRRDPEAALAGVVLDDLIRLARHNLFLVVTRDTFELWKHSPLRFRRSVALDRSALTSAITWDHDPEHYKSDPDCTLKLVFGNVPLWLDVRHRLDPSSLANDLTAVLKRRRAANAAGTGSERDGQL